MLMDQTCVTMNQSALLPNKIFSEPPIATGDEQLQIVEHFSSSFSQHLSKFLCRCPSVSSIKSPLRSL